MKKLFKKALTAVLACAMVIGTMSFTAAADDADSYKLFIAYGGDLEAENDWAVSYDGKEAKNVTATDAEIKVGESQTIALDFDAAILNPWYFAPVLLADDVDTMDVTVTAKIDGEEVALDATMGENAWWYEKTGNFENAIRLYGGFNEWATQYIPEDKLIGASKIEYTITLNAITFKAPEAAINAVESTEEYEVFVAIGADKDAADDWGWGFTGETVPAEGITVVNGTIKSGESTTVSVEFATPAIKTWWCAPVVVGENFTEGTEFEVEVYIDGNKVETKEVEDGKNWWYEKTGDYSEKEAVRLCGSFNTWGAQYIDMPENFSKLEYKITAKQIMIGEEIKEEVVIPDPVHDPITTFPADMTYGNYPSYTPDAIYTVTGDQGYVTIVIDYVTNEEGVDGAWNTYCCSAFKITETDGTERCYAFGGENFVWDVCLNNPDVKDIVGGSTNADGQWYASDPETGHNEIRVLASKGATIGFYAIGWENVTNTVWTVDVVEGDVNAGTTETTVASEDKTTAADATAASNASTDNRGDVAQPSAGVPFFVWIIIGVVCAAVVAVVVVCVVKSKKKSE